jgi:short-subunit dehydrogenase
MKTAIIIGATSGIGNALAKRLVSDGYTVGITGRRTPLLEALKAENPERYLVRTHDVTETETSAQTLEHLAGELGRLDLLVLCAGTGDHNESLDFGVEKRTIDTNVTGFTAVADWAFTFFQNQKHGHLVVISSVAGLRGHGLAPAYGASKAYQISYAQSLQHKAAKTKERIYVTDIRPGFVDTAMAKGEGVFWVASTDTAARQIHRAIVKKKKVAYITRRWFLVAMLLKRLPNFLYNRL